MICYLPNLRLSILVLVTLVLQWFVFNMDQGPPVWSEWLVFNRVNARARKGLVLGPMRLLLRMCKLQGHEWFCHMYENELLERSTYAPMIDSRRTYRSSVFAFKTLLGINKMSTLGVITS
uniref:Putative ovule protein n=1 Tax=Solanum chacoense TaxID=4108 RepID=A0A0V0IJL0_SOLCH